MTNINRRNFMKAAAVAVGAASLPVNRRLYAQEPAMHDLVKVANGQPAQLVEESLKALGGIERFISKGDKVVVKPNMGWDRKPAQGANTHPEVVSAIVTACLNAGAKEVQVFDYTCNLAKGCYRNSGIEAAAKSAGAKVSFILKDFFVNVNIKDGLALKKWEFYKPALDADKYINVPVLKQHTLSRVTMGMKNIMGVIGGNRGNIHNDFDRKIVDLNSVIKPALTIIDATRVLRRNGPQGGNIGDVEVMNTLFAGIDPVAIDGAAADFFGIRPNTLGFLMIAQEKGMGSLKNIEMMKEIDLAG